MKKIATWIATFALVVGGGIAVFWPIDFWRLFDANLRPLALTHAENYCAGTVGIAEGFKFDSIMVERCLNNTSLDNETPSIAKSVRWACQGIVQGGWAGSVGECINIFEANQMWTVATGGLTMSWNDAHPRPRAIDEGVIEKEKTRDNRATGVNPYGYGTQEDE